VGDVLALTWRDVYDFKHKKLRPRIEVTEQKTKKQRGIALNKDVTKALLLYKKSLSRFDPATCLFPNNRKGNRPIGRSQAGRIVRRAADAIGLSGHISCHSLRKTFGYHAWQEEVPVALIMDIYHHSSFAVTRRYLGIAQDDRDKVYIRMSLIGKGGKTGKNGAQKLQEKQPKTAVL
jgi:integrase